MNLKSLRPLLLLASLCMLLAATQSAPGQWKGNGERAENAPDRKAVGGFGSHLMVVEKPLEFIKEWLKPETPQIKTASKVKPGTPLGVIVLFAGCKPDARGVCNAEVDYAIYKPDGTPYAARTAQPLWKEQAPPPPNIQLGRAILSLSMNKADPAGEYKVKAEVRDLNANVSFELETKFTLAK